ncbi:MAG: PH domain-containing protein [Clostridia bacterium]|nr:PH domain-containing protein [Clostridia bacterium]
MFEKRRCHFTYIFEMFARFIYVIVVVVSTIAFNIASNLVSDEDFMSQFREISGVVMSSGAIMALIVIGALVLVSLLILLLCAFVWRYTFISAEENTLIYESGKFIKRRVAIPFEKINTIDMGRNIFERMVGTCRLKIDTGAYSNRQEKNNAELDLVFSLKEAEQIRSFILSRAELDSRAEDAETGKTAVAPKEPDWIIKAGMGDFVLYGLTSSSVWKLFWALVAGVFFVVEIAQGFMELAIDYIAPYAEWTAEALSRTNIALIILGLLIIYLISALVSDVWTVIWAAVRFYDFRVAREGRNVIVRYGLITVKNYTLQVRNIHALIIRQNVFQQILGRCSVEAVCMGFGDEKSETALLFPIIKTGDLNRLLSVILPEYVTEMNVRPKNRAGIYYHIVKPAIIWGAIFAGTCFGCSFVPEISPLVNALAILLFIAVIAGRVLSYRNTMLDWNDSVVSVQSGGFKKTAYRIRTDAVQEVQLKTNVIKKRFGIGSYYVHYHGPTFNNTSVSGNISDKFFAGLAESIED